MSRAQLEQHLADPNPNVSAYARAIDPDVPLDRWISFAVKVLRDAGVPTYESCQGGPGHSYAEPAVRFHGTNAEGYRAVTAALNYGLPVSALRRVWSINRGEELDGPTWEITFWPGARLRRRQRAAEAAGYLVSARADPAMGLSRPAHIKQRGSSSGSPLPGARRSGGIAFPASHASSSWYTRSSPPTTSSPPTLDSPVVNAILTECQGAVLAIVMLLSLVPVRWGLIPRLLGGRHDAPALPLQSRPLPHRPGARVDSAPC